MKVLRSVPLALTILRVLLGPTFLIVHRQHGAVEWLVFIVAVALVTDWLDGATARWWNAVSTAGKLLDPLADAFFCMVVFVDLALHGLIWAWVPFVLITREALVTFALRPYALRKGVVVAAGMLGKIKTSLQFITILLVLMMLLPVLGEMTMLQILKSIMLIAVVGFSVASATQYAWGIAKGRGREQGEASKNADESRKIASSRCSSQ